MLRFAYCRRQNKLCSKCYALLFPSKRDHENGRKCSHGNQITYWALCQYKRKEEPPDCTAIRFGGSFLSTWTYHCFLSTGTIAYANFNCKIHFLFTKQKLILIWYHSTQILPKTISRNICVRLTQLNDSGSSQPNPPRYSSNIHTYPKGA